MCEGGLSVSCLYPVCKAICKAVCRLIVNCLADCQQAVYRQFTNNLKDNLQAVHRQSTGNLQTTYNQDADLLTDSLLSVLSAVCVTPVTLNPT